MKGDEEEQAKQLMTMHKYVLVLFLASLVLPVHAQRGGPDFFSISQEVNLEKEALQEQAVALAESEGYLEAIGGRSLSACGAASLLPASQLPDGVGAAAPVAVPGDVFLRIAGVAFTLYLRPIGTTTEILLETRNPDVPDDAKELAEQFLEQLAGSTEVD